MEIPEGVNNLGRDAFANCKKLTNITLPASTIAIGNYAFINCYKLSDVFFAGNAPEMGSKVFDLSAGEFTVFYLKGKKGFTSPKWKGYPAVEVENLPMD